MDIKDKIKRLPDSPGVYLMKDAGGKVIYIGKALSLKKRVRSYFTGGRPYGRQRLLLSEIRGIDYIPARTESEALIYEASLIKSARPKFNVEFKDDKSYPYLKLTLNEKYPRLLIARGRKADGARYYGPYTNARLLRQALSFMRRVFSLRTCNRLGKRPCTRYHISECTAPCAGKISRASYARAVRELILFLEGKRQRLLDGLSREMEKAARRLDFEEAMRIRNRITALSTVVTKGGVPSAMDQIDELKFLLKLKRRPARIEAFDISNIRGKEAVGSMVSFYHGEPDKNNYRKFRIKTVEGIDDYRMMREVVRRRYRRLLDEKRRLPDLVIIDGGRGHLSAAMKELKALGISHIPVIGIAKEFEHIYSPRRRLPIVLPSDSSVLQLIRRIRDEAHRFAKKYHLTLRRKKLLGKKWDTPRNSLSGKEL